MKICLCCFTAAIVLLIVIAVPVATLAVPECKVQLVESIPEGMTYRNPIIKRPSTYDAWTDVVDAAKKSLNIASFYWKLLAGPEFNMSSTEPGQDTFDRLIEESGRLKIRIAQNGPKKVDIELDQMGEAGSSIFWVDVGKLLGDGIVHTKLLTADGAHGYFGSANMDWRSLTQVKELGTRFSNCPAIVADLDKIHATYIQVSTGIPATWPESLTTNYNHTNPLKIKMNGMDSQIYFSASPTALNPPGRTYDLDAILNVMNTARKFIYISVMSYSPVTVHRSPKFSTEFWPVIDDALRASALDRGVEVRLLVSIWPHTSKRMRNFMDSLKAVDDPKWGRIRVALRIGLVTISNSPQESDLLSTRMRNRVKEMGNAQYEEKWKTFSYETGIQSLLSNHSIMHSPTFWPVIDDALRASALDRGVEVRLLVSIWPHTSKRMRNFMDSLKAVDDPKWGRIRVALRIGLVTISNSPQESDLLSTRMRNRVKEMGNAQYEEKWKTFSYETGIQSLLSNHSIMHSPT